MGYRAFCDPDGDNARGCGWVGFYFKTVDEAAINASDHNVDCAAGAAYPREFSE